MPEALHRVVGHDVVQQAEDEGAEQGKHAGEAPRSLIVAPRVKHRAHYPHEQDELDGEEAPIEQFARRIETDEALERLGVAHRIRNMLVGFHRRSDLPL